MAILIGYLGPACATVSLSSLTYTRLARWRADGIIDEAFHDIVQDAERVFRDALRNIYHLAHKVENGADLSLYLLEMFTQASICPDLVAVMVKEKTEEHTTAFIAEAELSIKELEWFVDAFELVSWQEPAAAAKARELRQVLAQRD